MSIIKFCDDSSLLLPLLDVSWGNYQVCLKLSTQKLFCSNSNCERRIFTTRLPKIAAPWARRTKRLNTQLTKVGLAQGGLPGSRLTQHFGITISRVEPTQNIT